MKIKSSSYLTMALLAACGQTTNMETANTRERGEGSSVVLKTMQSSSSQGASDATVASSSAPEGKISFNLTELKMNQGDSKDIEVSLKTSLPSGQVSIAPQALPKVKFDLLDASGVVLSGPVKLDAQGEAKLKLRVSSNFERTATKVTAPGPVDAELVLNASSDAARFSGRLPLRVSKAAVIVMSNELSGSVAGLMEKTFEFPAGTVPIFANPADKVVVKRLHFAGGQFKHQPQIDMAANQGYCPLGGTIISLGVPVSTACLPCPDSGQSGSFYNHDKSAESSNAREIIFKKEN